MSVPAGTRFIGIQPGVDMVERKSSQANSPTEVYTIEDIQSAGVPYVGATQDVDLGEYELKAGQIELDQSPTGTAGVAVTRWNNTIGSTETTLKGGSVILKNGVDLVARVVNKVTPNATLTKADYKVVKISGAQGQRLAVDYAQANNDNNSADTLGVVIETIPTNQEGFIMTVGQLEDINTTGSLQGETWADGDVLYLSPTVPGNVTKVKPTGAIGHIVVIGYVEYSHAVHGKIYIKIMNGWELDELHNVYINSGTLANNDALIYNSTSQLWENKQVTESVISLSDVTTNNVSTSKHGFAPKLPNDATKFLDGTGNYTSPPTGITVGTTAVTSGTDGRVFFQAGGVLQQDGSFTFDNSLKRLSLKAAGTASTDIPFKVRNSADTADILTVAGNRTVWARGGGNQTTNTAFGETAFYTNTTGTDNVAIGYGALEFNTTGYRNVAIGRAALNVSTVEGQNTAVGYAALQSNTTAYNNTGIGAVALSGNTTGINNTALGSNALRDNTTGSENIAIGFESGKRITGGSSLTSATSSIFIGSDTRANSTAQSNQIVIGYQAEGLGSNTTVIGNTSTTLFRPYGNVAIGANTASARLDVRAQGALSTDIAFRIGRSTDNSTQFEVNGQGLTTINTSGGGGANSFSVSLIGGNENFRVQENGIVRFRSIYTFTNSTQMSLVVGNALTNGLTISTLNNYDVANTTRSLIGFNPTFSHSNGTNSGNILNIIPTINTTGGTNTVRGLYYNPTLTSLTGTTHRAIENTTGDVIFGSTSGNVAIGGTSFGTSSDKVLAQYTGTAPSTSPADAYQMYSADVVGGNAAPHFRTENGAIVKVYQETTAVAAATLVSNAGTNITDTDTFDGYTLKQIVKALRNQGLLA